MLDVPPDPFAPPVPPAGRYKPLQKSEREMLGVAVAPTAAVTAGGRGSELYGPEYGPPACASVDDEHVAVRVVRDGLADTLA